MAARITQAEYDALRANGADLTDVGVNVAALLGEACTERTVKSYLTVADSTELSNRCTEPPPWPAVMPMPPSTNNLFKNAGKHGRIKTPAYKEWLAVVVPLLRPWARELNYPVELEFVIREKMSVQADVSNRIKAAEDALVLAGVIKGDSRKYVRKVSIEYLPGGTGVSVSVRDNL